MSTIGDKINSMYELREARKQLEKQDKQLKQQYDLIERELLTQMESEGVTKSTGKHATASASESVKPQVEDWDRFYDYIYRHQYFHLLERRPSVTGCRELFETKGNIPGVVPYTMKTIRLTSIHGDD